MNEWPYLTKAPIVEGLIDLRVARSAGVTLARLKAAAEELAEEFPSRQERRQWTGQINLSPTEATKISTHVDEPDGIILTSADEKWVVQFQLDGLTVSRLHPYPSWAALITRAALLWDVYRRAAEPAKIVRVGSRFINSIPLPPNEPFERTFSTTFTLSSSLPQAIAGFFLRIVIPFDSEQSTAIMTQTLPEGSNDCIFDLDAFEERSGGFTISEAWEKLEVLRGLKNRMFFGSLTVDAVERFK